MQPLDDFRFRFFRTSRTEGRKNAFWRIGEVKVSECKGRGGQAAHCVPLRRYFSLEREKRSPKVRFRFRPKRFSCISSPRVFNCLRHDAPSDRNE